MRWTHTARTPLLALVEHIGLAEYPGLAALAYTPPTQPGLRAAIAARAQRSLLLRLLADRPWQAYELCRLQIGHAVYYDAGEWSLNSSTTAGELSWSDGLHLENAGRALPVDLGLALEEFLNIWRPMLTDAAEPALFLTRAGLPHTVSTLNCEVARVFWRYTRRSISLPQIRQLWAVDHAARPNRTEGLRRRW